MKRKFIKNLTILILALSVITPTVIANAENAPLLISTKKVDRLSGKDRFETSVKISQNGWVNGADKVIIVNAYGFADALCAGPLAKKYDAPILLSGTEKLDSVILAEIKRLNPKQIIIVGGEGAISADVKNQLAQVTAEVKRIAGQNRYGTSLAVALEFGDAKNIVIASGNGYADALSIAPIAAQMGMPIILTDKDDLDVNVLKYINSKSFDKTYLIGGEAVISSSVEKSLKNSQRLWGANRFLTNLSVLKAFEKEINFDKMFIALGDGPNGDEFADALSGAALAGKMSTAIALTYGTMDIQLENYIKSKMTSKGILTSLGGENVVPNSISEKLMDVTDKNNGEVKNPVVVPGASTGGAPVVVPPAAGGEPKKVDIKIVDTEAFKIVSSGERLYFTINSKDNVDGKVAIIIVNESGTLKYIGEELIASGNITFFTALEAGNYIIKAKAVNGSKLIIEQSFTIK